MLILGLLTIQRRRAGPTMMMMDRNLILEPYNIFGHFVQPEDKQTQVENSSKTEKTTASYSSGLHWECLVSDVQESIIFMKWQSLLEKFPIMDFEIKFRLNISDCRTQL